MVRGGLIAAAVAMVGSAVSTHFWAFLLSRFLLGLGSGAVSPAIRRIIVNASSATSWAQISAGSRRSRSPASSSGRSSPPSPTQLFGLHAPFFFLAGVFLVALAAPPGCAFRPARKASSNR